MKILDIGAKEIRACAKFDYKGFEISASTIFKPASVQVTSIHGNRYDFPTVEDAIEYIEGYIKEQVRLDTL